MSQCEDADGGAPRSEAKDLRTEGTGSSAEPGPDPSCVSLKSDWSKDEFINFRGHGPRGTKRTEGTGSSAEPGPDPSCVSLKSNWSKDEFINFRGHGPSGTKRTKGAGSGPGSSCVSLKSNWSKDEFINFRGHGPHGTKRTEGTGSSAEPGPDPSCVSLKSNWSKDEFINFRGHGPRGTKRRKLDARGGCSVEAPQSYSNDHHVFMERAVYQSSKTTSQQSPQQDRADLDYISELLEEKIVTFVRTELKKILRGLTLNYPEGLGSQREDERLDGEGERRRSSKDALFKIMVDFLSTMNQEELAKCLQSRGNAQICQRELKSSLKEKFQCVFEGVAKAGSPTLLNQIYTELFITEGETGGVNDEHEVRQIELTSRRADLQERTIRLEDIFKGPNEGDKPVRTVMTKGVAGIGKTVLTQKFTLDWAEGNANQDIHFTLPFTFRQLNLLKDMNFSLVELVHHFFSETKAADICRSEAQVLFIFDGLDECRLPLDFHNNEVLTDVTESTSVDVLLTNLIRGNLLPSALLWITTRPAAANQIPPECVDMVSEVRGFNDPQKEEYFRKRFRDEEQADRIISHIKTTRSLHIMCHIPVFCWITATVLEDVLKTREGGELPKTLTDMYIYFLVLQTKVKNTKYDGGAETDPHWSPESRRMIQSLGKLAFEQLQRRNLIFYESDLTESGINIRAASVYSGVLTQIFREERGLYQDKVFCFVHLSVQEFLAALHVHLTFINSEVNLMVEDDSSSSEYLLMDFYKSSVTEFYESAVNQALESPNGHLDLFLRFLLGLSLHTNQTLLQGLQIQPVSESADTEAVVELIKEEIKWNSDAEKSITLFHCLNELQDHSLLKEVQQSFSSGKLSSDELSSGQLSAVAFILLSSGEDLSIFDLKKYSASEKALWWLLPVVKVSNTALLSGCNLKERGCKYLSSALSSQSCFIRELDLSNNNLKISGVQDLSVGLKSPNCKVETLRLSGCFITEISCKYLSSALSSQSCLIRELDLSNNDLKDSGVEVLSAVMKSPNCKVESLRLSGCLITEVGCASLASALKCHPSQLKELDLRYNHPGDRGVRLLSAELKNPLESLRVEPAGAKWLRPGLRKYSCELTVDMNTVNRNLKLCGSRTVTQVQEDQLYPDHPDRFQDRCPQLLCTDELTGRCYWEVEWSGHVEISVSYRGIRRRGDRQDCAFGANDQSWSLECSEEKCYSVWNNDRQIFTELYYNDSAPRGVAVHVDCPAGTLSFYSVWGDSLYHIYTFNTTFTEPLCPGFRFHDPGSSVTLKDQ